MKPWDPPEERLYPILDKLLDDWRATFRPGYAGVRVVGDRWSAPCHRVLDFLARNQVPYQFLEGSLRYAVSRFKRRRSTSRVRRTCRLRLKKIS